MVKLLLASFVEVTSCVHQQLNATGSEDARANRWIVVAAACSNVILRVDEQFRHRFGSEIPWHREVSNLVATEIRDLPWPIPLMPIRRYEDPAVAPYLRKESFVGRSDISGNVLLIDTIANVGSVELAHDFGAIPVLIKVESKIRQPSP